MCETRHSPRLLPLVTLLFGGFRTYQGTEQPVSHLNGERRQATLQGTEMLSGIDLGLKEARVVEKSSRAE